MNVSRMFIQEALNSLFDQLEDLEHRVLDLEFPTEPPKKVVK